LVAAVRRNAATFSSDGKRSSLTFCWKLGIALWNSSPGTMSFPTVWKKFSLRVEETPLLMAGSDLSSNAASMAAT